MSDIDLRIHSLHVHPVKSCGGIAVDEVPIADTGFDLDRAWMVVDADGEFVSMRELPRMALVRPSFRHQEIVLRAPGMLALHLRVDAVEDTTRVRVWDDELPAYDMGPLAAQWFSDFLGRKLRLARFDPEQQRLSSRKWTGDIAAPNTFSDGYPILVASTASLAELNRRLAAAGHAPVTMQRFRPNLVLDGLDAHGEDHLHEIRFEAADGPVVLRMVKPCARCPMPDVDPETAVTGTQVTDTLSAYRADARLDGALTFGMNAVIVEGVDRVLKTGMAGAGTWKFD
jgi:uncharacterized protein YcbX